MAIQKLKK